MNLKIELVQSIKYRKMSTDISGVNTQDLSGVNISGANVTSETESEESQTQASEASAALIEVYGISQDLIDSYINSHGHPPWRQ